MSRPQSEHKDTCDCWQCVDSGDRPKGSDMFNTAMKLAEAESNIITEITNRHDEVESLAHAEEIRDVQSAFTGKLTDFGLHKISFLYHSITTMYHLFTRAHIDRGHLLDYYKGLMREHNAECLEHVCTQTKVDKLEAWALIARRELVANHMCPECMDEIEFISHPGMGWACKDCSWTDDSLVWDNVYETNEPGQPSCECTYTTPCWKHNSTLRRPD